MAEDVEELRQRVDELEATVRGLTQELVEANERIRVLEEHAEDEALAAAANKPMADGAEEEVTSDEPTDASEESTEEPAEEDDDGVSDDIIVA